MNLLKQEMKELVKERYYEYLEEGYEPFEAMELAKKDIEFDPDIKLVEDTKPTAKIIPLVGAISGDKDE